MCFFFKSKRKEAANSLNIIYYQCEAEKALDTLCDDYAKLLDPQGHTVSITHAPSGHKVSACSDSAIDYYASIIVCVQRITEIIEDSRPKARAS